ncbi:acetyl-CoA carboxylase biotin carboxyl carrier protein [Flavobacterium psychrophilum]|jgi:acetyl-CoA carboxylase biotin carboxyl carrier protein|uniref:Biotin carboxyl carrier protein of acetyl-CoA carboxylase n=1 Tax=Flavobacterium psychrophilum (strain ATCC 49511 / DSM 21280 / CIP 103535 / JIP02/86) TaxID=402612 RepID=A6H259_FLAPJ|nr:acetyl-CoA carboxylase biotin carboxyl carrier protein [Flavobacterium psychrophilum]AIG31103.1 acetyl-CoA carboxylase [Flavobacterium psychrophilum]AIG33380.1 acetyl-CoA carboxylase [Flavobacterium psychrophilum]AIG35530.1 acetyl-CoA carboxylase [Flavobacterium psychrophilum]AIG37891.1 acetyl-CoA carboxylase [Flavobacterium psychrophilum]AIG40162.1 acetyl-CoA carboxylase [Flavobacterium psychrophilum]
MDLKEIQNLIKFVANSGVAEVKLETGDVKITIRTTLEGSTETTYVQQIPAQNMLQQAVAPQQIVPVVPTTIAPAVDENAKYITVKSPIIGTFYRKPSPDKPMFVEVGSTIGKGDVLCVIEAMKLFNEIESEVSGKIVKILVDDSSPVEFDQPLFLVDPS